MKNFSSDPPRAEWMTPGEAAAYLGVSVWTLRRYADRGEVAWTRLKPSSHRRYKRSDVVALRAERA